MDHKKRNVLLIVIVVAAVAVAALLLGFLLFGVAEAPTTGSGTATSSASTSTGATLANPASVNCVQKLGGTLQITDTAAGQVGYCHLPDGRVCEEWALFRSDTCTPPQ